MSEIVWIAIIAVVPTTLASIASLIVSLKSLKQVGSTHVLINSRMTELLAVTAKSSESIGYAAGRLEKAQEQMESRLKDGG